MTLRRGWTLCVQALPIAAALLAGCGPVTNGLLGAIGPRGDPDDHRFAPWKKADKVGRSYCPEAAFPAEGSMRYLSAAQRKPGDGLDLALATVGPSMAARFTEETSRPFYWYYASAQRNVAADRAECQVWMDGETLRVWAMRRPP